MQTFAVKNFAFDEFPQKIFQNGVLKDAIK